MELLLLMVQKSGVTFIFPWVLGSKGSYQNPWTPKRTLSVVLKSVILWIQISMAPRHWKLKTHHVDLITSRYIQIRFSRMVHPDTVDGSEIRRENYLWCIWNSIKNGDILHVNWWSPDFWTINSTYPRNRVESSSHKISNFTSIFVGKWSKLTCAYIGNNWVSRLAINHA